MRTEAPAAVRATTAPPEGGPALPPRISWGAVLAGAIAAAGIAATLNSLGTTIGATAVGTVARSAPGTSSLGIGAGVRPVVADTIAFAAGGYTAARFSGASGGTGGTGGTGGMLHGLAVWAIALQVSAAPLWDLAAGLVSPAASTLSSAVSGAVGGAAGGVAPYVSAAEARADPSPAVDRATDTPRGTGGAPRRMSTEQRAAEISSLLADRAARGRGSFTGEERARLDALVAAEAGVSTEEAGRRVQAVEADARRTAPGAAHRAREAADAGTRATLIGVLGTCAALLLGAAAAALAAPAGAAVTRWWGGIGPERRRGAKRVGGFPHQVRGAAGAQQPQEHSRGWAADGRSVVPLARVGLAG